jgi:hypothetical protein
MCKTIFISFLLLVVTTLKAQFTYSIDQSIPVEVNGKSLLMPWAGGVNSAQINTMDLNGDGKQDLVVFDRTSNKLNTYINQNNQYQYAPDYESLFPKEVSDWMLLRDFNCDGRKDIFTSDPFGILVYVNTTKPGKPLSWRVFNPGFPLLTAGFTSNVNLKVNQSDIPAIDDVDGDGDLDILNVRFVGVGTLEYHKNLSMERTGRCDSLQLQRITQTWGEFEECACGKIAFPGGKTCAQLLSGGRTGHTGGKALLTLDFNNDGVRDLFFSEESCSALYLLNNQGTVDNATMSGVSTFPVNGALSMPFFPAAYYEDIDFDGLQDLLVSPNLSARSSLITDFQKSLFLYKNSGTQKVPQFTFTKKNFLQDQMIDVGDFSVPAFMDMDGDGDQDLLVSNYSQPVGPATISQFENSGTSEKPVFRLITEDYFQMSLLNLSNLKIQFVDMNSDGKYDLVFSSTNKSNGATILQYITNSAIDKFLVTDATVKKANFTMSQLENWLVVDVDQDGQKDLLVGNDTGGIEYWKNQGSGGVNKYSLITDQFIGIGSSTDRQNLAFAVADLDADGRADLVTGDQHGELSIYGDFRSQNTNFLGATNVIFNNLTKEYEKKNLGGRLWPTSANLFNSNKPSLVVGNTLGGIMILKNDEGKELPTQPDISIYPNPYKFSSTTQLKIKADRNVLVQFYSLLGQRISSSYFVPANQEFPIDVSFFSIGIYIAQFSWNGKIYAKRFIIQ